jgi:hypothetical protein
MDTVLDGEVLEPGCVLLASIENQLGSAKRSIGWQHTNIKTTSLLIYHHRSHHIWRTRIDGHAGCSDPEIFSLYMCVFKNISKGRNLGIQIPIDQKRHGESSRKISGLQ